MTTAMGDQHAIMDEQPQQQQQNNRQSRREQTPTSPDEQLHRAVQELLCWEWTERNENNTPSSSSSSSSSTRHQDPLLTSVMVRHQHILEIVTGFEDRLTQLDIQLAAIGGGGDSALEQAYDERWTRLTWNLLTLLAHIPPGGFPIPVELDEDGGLVPVACTSSPSPQSSPGWMVEERLHNVLVGLVNRARSGRQPPMADPLAYGHFEKCFSATLHRLHELYSTTPLAVHHIRLFDSTFLQNSITAFFALVDPIADQLLREARSAQIRAISGQKDASVSVQIAVRALSTHYSYVMSTMTILAARIYGLRVKAWSAHDDALASAADQLYRSVVTGTERALAGGVLGSSTTAILVTNNLFAFNCAALAKSVVYRLFHVQIVAEDTAQAIQDWVGKVRRGDQSPTQFEAVSSAALLAMKPTTGVKRNNNQASAEGGNTAHKKSDVNSRESVQIAPSFLEGEGGWTAVYPHLLCTTRQKDTLVDSRAGQIGKRPLFYFYTRAEVFSAVDGRLVYQHALSLPFTIATRRNQDCQVQRMFNSYTATCFWLYGTGRLDRLLLVDTTGPVGWRHFRDLYDRHFRLNADVERGLDDSTWRLLKSRIYCAECQPDGYVSSGLDVYGQYGAPPQSQELEPVVSFRNLLCPHLRYEQPCSTTTSTASASSGNGQGQLTASNAVASPSSSAVRMSIWRGMLETLQLFQDGRTCVRTLWAARLLHGFQLVDEIERRIDAALSRTAGLRNSALAIRLSHILSGSVLFTLRFPSSSSSDARHFTHLEPIELKRLQGKSLADYLVEIAVSAKIDHVVDCTGTLRSITEIAATYGTAAGRDAVPRPIASNLTHVGLPDELTLVSYTPLRVAVVVASTTTTTTTATTATTATMATTQQLNGAVSDRKRAAGDGEETMTVEDEILEVLRRRGRTVCCKRCVRETIDRIDVTKCSSSTTNGTHFLPEQQQHFIADAMHYHHHHHHHHHEQQQAFTEQHEIFHYPHQQPHHFLSSANCVEMDLLKTDTVVAPEQQQHEEDVVVVAAAQQRLNFNY